MKRLGILLVAGILSPLAPTPSASGAVDDCTTMLRDDGRVVLTGTDQSSWQLDGEGYIYDAALGGQADAYDGFGLLGVDDGTNGLEYYDNTDTNGDEACTYEAGGRQIALPEYTTQGGLAVSRKLYVPATGGFTRFYNQVRNPGTAPVTVSVVFDGDVGSDEFTTLRDSSTGGPPSTADDVVSDVISWFSTDDEPESEDPVLTHNLDAALTQSVRDRVDIVEVDVPREVISYRYDDVTIPPGGTVSYVVVESMSRTAEAGSAAGRAIDTAPADVFAGLTDTELATVMNWSLTDLDRDGVANPTDNCRTAANPTQADLDRDGAGDACDSDLDGDGIANSVETAFGTDPAQADTDRDGVRDDADSCPRTAGRSADGCTVPTVVLDNVRSGSTTKVTGTMTGRGKVVVRVRGSVRSKGTVGARDCRNGLVQVVVRVGRLAVADRIVKLSRECTFRYTTTLDQPRDRVRDVSVRARFLGSDGLRRSAARDRI